MPESEALVAEAVPRAGSWPLVGNLPSMARGGMGYLDDQQRQHGDIYRIKAGPMPVVLLHHPDHVRHVFVTREANYRKQGTFWSSVRSLIGMGLPTAEGEPWAVRRRMMNPQFRQQRITALGEAMVEVIAEQLDTWEVDDPCFAVGDAVSRVTMAVIVRTMFGTGLDPHQSRIVTEAMAFSLDHMLQKVVTDAFPTWVPVPGRAAHRAAVARIDEVLYDVIRQRRASAEPGDDLLSMMLSMRDEGRGLTDEELRDETMSLFIAGYETTASAIAWALIRLADNPGWRERLDAEVARVLGERTPRPGDVPALDLCRRTFLETLRLDAPVFFLPRLAEEADVIDGRQIPAGTMVTVMIDRLHRHPDVWEAPERFDPDRFLPERAEGRHPYAWIPFGAGKRKCIGMGFAQMEGVLLLAMIAQRFRFEVPPTTSTAPRYAITKRPRRGLPLRVIARAAR